MPSELIREDIERSGIHGSGEEIYLGYTGIEYDTNCDLVKVCSFLGNTMENCADPTKCWERYKLNAGGIGTLITPKDWIAFQKRKLLLDAGLLGDN